MGKSTNGWRKGYDPVQRWLRILTTVVVLAVFVYLSAFDPNRQDSWIVVIALALGALLMLLGYEGVVKLPIIGQHERENEDD
jgi:peptidoglycan/LPS O-acetylase OafA/YrhL